jgi:hypothetical protein
MGGTSAKAIPKIDTQKAMNSNKGSHAQSEVRRLGVAKKRDVRLCTAIQNSSAGEARFR